jgi:uncharacterized protein
VKLSLFPQENKSLEMLADMAALFRDGVTTLSECLGAPAGQYLQLAEDVHRHDARILELHFAILTHVRTSFITPLPREDLSHISRCLVEAFERLDCAAELIALNQVKRLSGRASEQLEVIGRMADLTTSAMKRLGSLSDLDEYCMDMLQLAKRAERTHRNWISEDLRHLKPGTYVTHRDVADELVHATRELRRVSTHVGQILVKES